MSTHIAHDRNEVGLPLLCDGCPRCEEQAEDLGIHLDTESWRRAWAMMISVEFNDGDYLTGHYLSGLDKRLCDSLYRMALILQRQGMTPEVMFK